MFALIVTKKWFFGVWFDMGRTISLYNKFQTFKLIVISGR